MASMMFVLVTAHLNSALATWKIAEADQGCDAACASLGESCDGAGTKAIKSEADLRNVLECSTLGTDIIEGSNQIISQSKYVGMTYLRGNEEPLQFRICAHLYISGSDRVGIYCDGDQGIPDCAAKEGDPNIFRVCCCTGGPCTIPSSCGGVSVAGDPITYFGNLRVEFHLPVNQQTLLLKGSELQLHGTTFPGMLSDQWFKRITASTVDGEQVVDISIKENLIGFNRTILPHRAFETINVVMWDATPMPVYAFPPPDGFFEYEGITVTFARPFITSQEPRRECVLIATRGVKIIVCSASAHEYFGVGSGAHLHAHLDLEFMDLPHKASMAGVLPELWGLTPMSNATKAFILSQTRTGPTPSNGDAFPDKATIDFKLEGKTKTNMREDITSDKNLAV